VDFARGGCSFCGDCLEACRGRALAGTAGDEASAWNLRAVIDDACLSLRGVVCRSCGERCDEDTIRFRLEVGGVARPQLESERCNGCGACFAVCPVKAVRIVPKQSDEFNDDLAKLHN
jgi:ferredoxin-type protein NapF